MNTAPIFVLKGPTLVGNSEVTFISQMNLEPEFLQHLVLTQLVKYAHRPIYFLRQRSNRLYRVEA